MTEIRIDELARRAGLTVDTIRFSQREGLLPPAQRAGRAKVYGQDHLTRLAQIRDLQARRFSLAAIRALLESERPELVDGIFSGEGSLSYSLPDLVERSGGSAELAQRLRTAGLLRDPAEFGRDTYDATDLDVLRAAVELERIGLPDDVLVALASIYVQGVEAMQVEVLELFRGERGRAWDPEELRTFQEQTAASAGQLLPLVTRIVEYVHQRTLQRLTLGAIERERKR
ncbi:MAG: MerR family transcriptional regulator [Acidimicrobiia bacterium]